MADQKINALPVKTAPATGDKMLMIGAAEEYQIDYDQLATAILNKLTSKTYALDQGTKTLVAALNELNSNIFYKNPIVFSGLETNPKNIYPGHYYISEGLSTEAGWPADDTTNLVGTLLVIGKYSNPTQKLGYRVYLLFTNKAQFWIATEWWEGNISWHKIAL